MASVNSSAGSSTGSSLNSLESTYSDVIKAPVVLPASAVSQGKTLKHFRSVVVDMCSLTVTLLSNDLETFKTLLRAERIHYRSVKGASTRLEKHTLHLRDAEDLRQLICKLPPALHNVTSVH